MPIRPENRARYPKDWPEISLRIRERAGWACEWCGAPNGQHIVRLPGTGIWAPAAIYVDGTPDLEASCAYADAEGRWRGPDGSPVRLSELPGGFTDYRMARLTRVVLTVAHLDHTPEHCSDDNLAALCQRCHLMYDRRARGRSVAPLVGRSRRLECRGQLTLAVALGVTLGVTP